ncbi:MULTISPECIES: LCP family protein [unclassified Exiguobacterium]|uniref:LCP family glycopolymer transferase n=1 Tax=unclassified Exiguobacterium TaxID=2644629 RepID=UPI0025BE41E8|nr:MULTISPECIES: LCP family protein [unclassified Exiguobacterium]MDT0172696.1 LCP family protein [Exiguobacterium sp. BRG2]
MKKWKWIVLTLTGICLLLLFRSGGYVYHKASQTLKEVQVPVKASVETEKTVEQKKGFSFLLLGVDQRKNETGRSDTIIVVTIDPKTNTSQMISIPRDLKTDIIGNGSNDKINHAYAFGGPQMALDTVSHLLKIRIDYFAEINLAGFTDLVNAVDGVRVKNDINFSYYEMQFPKGELLLNGKEALAYARMRHDDPRGDFGRQIRQRQVVQAVADKMTEDFSIRRFNAVLDALGKNVKTNVPFSVARTVVTDYRDALRNVETLSLDGKGGIESDGIYYWHPTNKSLKEVQAQLQNALK